MLKKTFFFLSVFCLGAGLSSFSPNKQKMVRTIIIDAGHGGRDVGARGDYSYEKDICLGVSLKLGQQILKEVPDVKLIYTRTGDTYPELHARASLANQNKGDLFISIHVNAAPPRERRVQSGYKNVVTYVGKGKSKKKVTKKVPTYRIERTPNPAKGTETYIWGAHKNEDKEVAMRENAPMLAEDNFNQKYGDIDPNSPEFIALSLLKTKQFFKRSATLAGMVEEQFEKVGRISRGQKQRQVGIWVLQATAMPSVLVETGYITNREEEDYLNSQSGQQEIAYCVGAAVKDYVSWLEKNQTPAAAALPVKNTTTKATQSFLDAVDNHEKQRLTK